MNLIKPHGCELNANGLSVRRWRTTIKVKDRPMNELCGLSANHNCFFIGVAVNPTDVRARNSLG